MPELTIRNDCAFIQLAGREDALWVCFPLNGPHAHPIAPPVFEIDGVPRAAVLKGIRESAPVATLANGCTEYRFVGSFADDPALSLEMVFRLAPDSPIVRFRYVLKSRTPRRLTKSSGADGVTYLGVNLGGYAATEVRFSEFDEGIHSYRCVERAIKDADFAAGLSVMGPLLAASAEGGSFLAAYEHGSTAPIAFLEFALESPRRVTLRAVRGNYSRDEALDAEHPFETIWFDVAAVDGDADALAAAFREFLLKYQALRPASRRPAIFYNTWCLQERDKWLNGRTYLASMNEARMLEEIDAAAGMGVEVFVLDAGWYESTGDWNVDPKRFPRGLGPIKARLDAHGMELGLWFAPPWAAVSSRALASHRDCLMTEGGKPAPPHSSWESEESVDLCLVSRWADAFADALIRVHREFGATYFKWDAVSGYGCDDPGHAHGGPSLSAAERADRFKFELPRAMARIAAKVAEACPEAICDFDVTESHRCVGLAFLEAGKYFLVNNGPYDFNFDAPRSHDHWINVFTRPGPARARVCRSPVDFDRWIPSTLFLTHFLPDDPAASQRENLASLVLGFGGLWGDLRAVSAEGAAFIGGLLARYKQVRDDMAEAPPVRSGPVGGSPEVHEKINPRTGRGAVVLFASVDGEYTYVTSRSVAGEFRADGDVSVAPLPDGRARITVRFSARQGGACIVFFGAR